MRSWFADLGDRLTPVDVEGDGGSERAWLLTEHADDLAATEPSRSVRLVGAFDQYVLGPGTRDTALLAAEHRSRVSRAAGWIAPVVVLGGRVVGTWDRVDDDVVVSLFPDAEKPPPDALEAEATHLARVLGRDLRSVRTEAS